MALKSLSFQFFPILTTALLEDTLLGCWFSHSNPGRISDSLAEDSSILITNYSRDIRLLFCWKLLKSMGIKIFSEIVDFF